MKQLTNKQRCKNCLHKCVCPYQDYFHNVEGLERCKHYLAKEKKPNPQKG